MTGAYLTLLYWSGTTVTSGNTNSLTSDCLSTLQTLTGEANVTNSHPDLLSVPLDCLFTEDCLHHSACIWASTRHPPYCLPEKISALPTFCLVNSTGLFLHNTDAC